MAERCEYFVPKIGEPSKTIRNNRNPVKSPVFMICAHPNSRHNGKTVNGPAICEGDRENKCDIS